MGHSRHNLPTHFQKPRMLFRYLLQGGEEAILRNRKSLKHLYLTLPLKDENVRFC